MRGHELLLVRTHGPCLPEPRGDEPSNLQVSRLLNVSVTFCGGGGTTTNVTVTVSAGRALSRVLTRRGFDVETSPPQRSRAAAPRARRERRGGWVPAGSAAGWRGFAFVCHEEVCAFAPRSDTQDSTNHSLTFGF